MKTIDEIRNEISQCDEKIIQALTERYALVKEIVTYKQMGQVPMIQQDKLDQQMAAWKALTEAGEFQEEILSNLKGILRTSRRIQVKNIFPYNIFLIGFMGVGKSSIASGLCELMDMDMIEMDAMIVEKQNMSITDIFARYGESYFRNLESNVLIELQQRSGCVVSCGGGIVMRPDNVVHMKARGRVVLLTAMPETVLQRVSNNNDRPILNNNMNVEFIDNLMEQRREIYLDAADLIVSTDNKSISEICIEMISQLVQFDLDHKKKGAI